MGRKRKKAIVHARKNSTIKRIIIVGDAHAFSNLIEYLYVLGLPFSHMASIPIKIQPDEFLVEAVGFKDERVPKSAYSGWFSLYAERHVIIIEIGAYDTQLQDFASELRKVFIYPILTSQLRKDFERLLDGISLECWDRMRMRLIQHRCVVSEDEHDSAI